MNLQRLRNRRGIGLLELMLSLGVIAILLLMITRYFTETRESLKVTQSVRYINTLVQASFNWLEGNTGFDQLCPSAQSCDAIQTLVDTGELAKGQWDKSNRQKDPWGGDITLESCPPGSGTCTDSKLQILIKLGKVPEAACKNINDIMSQHNMQLYVVCSTDSGYQGYYPAVVGT